MALTPNFNEREVRRTLEAWKEQKMHKAIISRLTYIGESFVGYARENGDYGDVTGNLRSSIGFAVLYKGEIMGIGGFEQADTGTDRITGTRTGRQFLETLIGEYQNFTYCLIGVAGMEYAGYLEAALGRDVITGASIRARNDLMKAIQELGKQ
ncbi:hypothetical protein [Adhaeribacter aquaticus]|uniref:hypothetical protein n=1 Tax=Adhaeribacter aquaticus TaxID=299567 RepID=UPI00042373C1|nr:hypothetical protein [Adhaeribacter aquaticus]